MFRSVTVRLRILLVVPIIGLFCVTSCTSNQDKGDGANLHYFSGRAIDGVITQGIVFFDVNQNNVYEPLLGETFAYLDSDGYFSYNPRKQKNYCTSSSTADKKYCLSTPVAMKSAMLRVTRGFDTAVREKFIGTLSAYITDVDQYGITDIFNVSPIAGFVTTQSQTNTVFPNNEAITDSATLLADPFSDTNTLSDLEKTTLLRLGQQIHKVSEVIATLINTYSGKYFDKESGFPRDVNHFSYTAIAEEITNTKTLNDVLTDSTTIAAVVDTATNLTAAYVAKLNTDGKSDVTLNILTSNQKQDIASKAASLAGQIKVLFEMAGTVDDTYVFGRLRAIEVIAILMRDTDAGTKYQNAIDESNRPLYLQRLGAVTSDVAYTAKLFKDQASYTPGSIESQIDFSNRPSLSNLDNISIQDPSCSSNCESFGFALTPDAEGSNTGTATVTLNLGNSGISSGGDTVTGSYTKIDDYTMIMNVEVSPGVTMPTTMKLNPDGTYSVDFANQEYSGWK